MDDRSKVYEAPTIEELGSVLELTEATGTTMDLDGAPFKTPFHHTAP